MGVDSFFEGVEEFNAATNPNRQEAKTERMTNTASEDLVKSSLPGFNDTDVVVIEAIKGRKCKFGSGILLQDPQTWGKINKGNKFQDFSP